MQPQDAVRDLLVPTPEGFAPGDFDLAQVRETLEAELAGASSLFSVDDGESRAVVWMDDTRAVLYRIKNPLTVTRETLHLAGAEIRTVHHVDREDRELSLSVKDGPHLSVRGIDSMSADEYRQLRDALDFRAMGISRA